MYDYPTNNPKRLVEILGLIISLFACIATWLALYPIFKGDARSGEKEAAVKVEETAVVSSPGTSNGAGEFEVTFANDSLNYLRLRDIVEMPPQSLTTVQLPEGVYQATLERSTDGVNWWLDSEIKLSIDGDGTVDCRLLNLFESIYSALSLLIPPLNGLDGIYNCVVR